ncbi:MAG: tetratricopeptide repeat protein [Bacteroidetes bacterium]|nr:hypothetical protein AWN76_005045 [Rhodothermaceae bacterium RA]RMH54055.1 MAG: tetratricopeptide repeat protein [Bacteroidota bacterium]
MKRSPLVIIALIVGAFLAAGAGCSSDPNVEGAKLDLRNKDYDRALENVNEALARNPENMEAWDLKGQILQEQLSTVDDVEQHSQLVEEMVEAYQRAKELGAGDDVDQRLRLAFYNEFQRGFRAFEQGREDEAAYEDAIQYFRNAALIQPDSAGAYVNMAYAMINAGRQEDAIEPFEKAIELGEDSPDTYIYLSELYRVTGRNDDAVGLLERAKEVYPDNVDIDTALLNAYQAAGRTDEALEQYRAAVERDPNNKLYRYNYGTLLLGAERFDEAIEQLKAAIELDPEYVDALSNLGSAYTNKAVAINDQIREMDDALRQERANLSEQEIQQREAEMDALVEQRTEMFRQAIEPLERAQAILEARGEDAQRICFALFQAYAQTRQTDKAESVAACAGVDVN